MITVEVSLFASLRKYHPGDGRGSFSFEVPEGTALNELFELLSIPEEETKMAFVNNRSQEYDYILKDGDEIGIFPPVAGG